MLCHGQNLLECFLAGVAEELIVGHTGLPQSKNGCSWILDPRLEQVQLSPYALRKVNFTYTAGGMTPTIEKISAITFRVLNMQASVQFYRNVLGMELLYGGERASFSSLRANDSESAILNLERGDGVSRWGRLIFHVTDVDAFWTHLKERGFDPEIPRDASWGERYFHMLDPDGHELSFAHQRTPVVA
jgi:catechol 2,3-dioxygenase-like lactoylglutathione lyase family enzyme